MHQPKICIGPQWESSNHRSGWKFAVDALKPLHKADGPVLDTFVESNFSWNRNICLFTKVIPYRYPWIGIIHNPHNMPEWFGDGHSSNPQIFSQEEWKESIKYCKGLFTLSDYHRSHVQRCYPQLLVDNLLHPTETPEIKFNFEQFQRKPVKLLVQVGWWLRKSTLHQLPTTKYKKCILNPNNDWQSLMKVSEEAFQLDESVGHIPFQNNENYDKLLSESLVFLDLFDSSANNAIIECIVRATPVLVNPLPAVIEYLGKDYPLYFHSLEEAAAKAEDMSLVEETHRYLKATPMLEKLTKDYFLDSFSKSRIYESL